jgi:hypothetical protein
MKKNFIIGVLLLFASQILFAQYLEQRPMVTVTATASVKANPDMAIISLRYHGSVKSGKVIGNDLLSQISYESILSFVTARNYDVTWCPESLTNVDGNFKISRPVVVTLHNLSVYRELLREIVKPENFVVERVEFRTTKLAELKNEARMLAVNQAKKNAEVLAKELEQTIGKAFTITEKPSAILCHFNPKFSSAEEPVSPIIDSYLEVPGYLSITSEVEVSFELR